MAASVDVLTIGRPTTSSSVMFKPGSRLKVSHDNLSRSATHLKPLEKKPSGEFENRFESNADLRRDPYFNHQNLILEPNFSVPNADLSSIEIENILRSRVKSNYANLLQGFRNYDINRIDAVSKGEFRRVIEAFGMALTSEQFESIIAKVPTNRSGALLYIDFLDRFYGKEKAAKDEWVSSSYRFVKTPAKAPQEINLDQVEKQLHDKIKANAKDFIRSFHLFDYNRDGKIQRHDFRKVLDNNAIKLNDSQFDKFWLRYDFHHSNTIDYKDFLRRIGVKIMAPASQMDKQPTLGVDNRPVQKPDESISPFKKLNIDQLDSEFRARMRSNYVNVKLAMAACDKHNDGFISLDDLRAVLSAFTIPMSEQLFNQLMERAQIKASGKVCWGVVLSKFQDPQSFGNGQTIPIKMSHKYFPVKQDNNVASSDELWNLLNKHVTSAYGSFKSAFLQMDQSRTGRLTRKDIKKVLKNFKINLTKAQLSKLMKRLDPENTNSIDYVMFLGVFEPRETEEGHKWLNSEHKFNNEQKPLILAWEVVEDILREKLSDNWSSLAAKFISYDPLESAKINKAHLRKLVTSYCIPISDEHFEHMMSQISDVDGNKVNYIEWLARLGVDVKPGDISGLSTQIFNAHNKEMDKRYSFQQTRHAETDQSLLDRTAFMSPEEVIIRLRDRMLQHKKGIRDAFLEFDVKKNGKISKSNFRKVLNKQGMLLDDEMFSQICNLLKFDNGVIDYYTFIDAFDDPRGRGTLVEGIKKSENHRVNKHRGDDFGMTAEQAERKLRSKLRENFADLRAAFYKFDSDHNGLVSRRDFQRMLDSFMIIMSREEFNRLCDRLGMSDKKTRISYQDFLDRFQLIDTFEGHKWLLSEHKFNFVKDTPNLSAEQAHQLIVEKGYRQWRDLSQAFINLDGGKTGRITKRGMRELLQRFILPMTEEEFTKLWRRYDEQGIGYITHKTFLDKIGVSLTAGDEEGVSKAIVDNSVKNLYEHHENMNYKHEMQTYNQAMASWNMNVDTIYSQLKDRIRDGYSDFYSAFKKYDQSKTGVISTYDLRKVLLDLSYYLSDEQFIELIQRLGFQSSKGSIDYIKFLKAFEEGRSDLYEPAAPDVTHYRQFDHLSPEKAEAKLKKYTTEQSAALTAIFQALDKNNTGFIPVEDFRRVLDSFCFKMTDVQFKSIVNKLRSTGDREVNYPAFMDTYQAGFGSHNIDFNDRVMNELKSPNDDLTGESFFQMLREAINNKFYHIARHFTEIDYAKIGVVAKDDFYDVIAKNCFRMTQTQFENLWSTLKVNQFGNADYREFLKAYSSNQSLRETKAPLDGRLSAAFNRRPASQMTQGAERELMFSRAQSRADSRAGSRFGNGAASRAGAVTPMVNAQDTESKIQVAINSSWRKIQEQCRIWDPQGTGEIEASQFKALIEKFRLDIDTSDFHALTTKYDVNNNGKFCYTQFLKNFVLNMTPKSQQSSRRKLLAESKAPQTPGLTGDQFYLAMLRIRENILSNWKEMRRQFRKCDPTNSGGVNPVHFRNVLRLFNVNLDEDEFYHLMTYYDKGMTGNISYNDFIGHFLRSTQ